MIGRVETLLRRLRRLFSRTEWLARLLRLPVSTAPPTAPGLVMIQIDGLPMQVVRDSIDAGQMPFLRRLLDREHYRLHPQYSGVPSSTAAVQAELFYGVRTAVPGFNFMDRSTGELVRMYEPSVAARIERELAAKGGAPLLAGGSCYADNFTGGADEPHFCPAALGWGPALHKANPLAVVMLLGNPFALLRAAALSVLEVVIAIGDVIRGIIDGHSLLHELKFVPSRVAISVLLRELTTTGAMIDVARGLPAVHVNFLGYDEQSHRRGPNSAFARWTLKGIDDAIRRIWGAAHRSSRRHYDVWIYSDHGQETVVPYHRMHGRDCAEAIAEVVAEHAGTAVRFRASGEFGPQIQRARLLRGRRRPGEDVPSSPDPGEAEPAQLAVAPLGPVAMIYYDAPMSGDERAALARDLVNRAGLPMVLSPVGGGEALAWTAAGNFVLPEQAEAVLGPDHPYLDEAARDLAALCHHPDAGTFVACGYVAGKPAVSFGKEHGAHGGVAPGETSAFALLPGDAPLSPRPRDHLRPDDLRQAALRFLGRSSDQPAPDTRRDTAPKTLRIMTYNVHSCIGMDGRLSPERIARIIVRHNPDIVALQELDVGRDRTQGIDQAHLIARYLDMDFHFHPTVHVEEERYGDAILTHLPMRLVKADVLPSLPGRRRLEPRGALWVAIDLGGRELHVVNTHLGLVARERQLQAAALLGPEWLAHPDMAGPVVLCGDFNALPGRPTHRTIQQRLDDAQLQLKTQRPKGTFYGRMAKARIDYVFVDPGLEVIDVEVPNSELTCLASDHLPVIAELRVPPPAADEPPAGA